MINIDDPISFSEILSFICESRTSTFHILRSAYIHHEHIYRKDGEDYINHPVRAAIIAKRILSKESYFTDTTEGVDELSEITETLLLHDVWEDPDWQGDYKESDFFYGISSKVMTNVFCLTSPDKLDRRLSSARREHKKMSQREFISCVSMKIMFMKLVDRLDNIISLEKIKYPGTFDIASYRSETQLLMNSIVNTLKRDFALYESSDCRQGIFFRAIMALIARLEFRMSGDISKQSY